MIELLRFSRSGLEVFLEIERKPVRKLQQNPLLCKRLELLRTIPGVGEITSLTWALEISDPKRFKSIDNAVSYCGLSCAFRASAGKIQRGPISKQRNAHLQTTLIEAAKLAPRWNPVLKQVRDKEIKRGDANQATLAVARKLVAYLMAVDRSQKPFRMPPGETEPAAIHIGSYSELTSGKLRCPFSTVRPVLHLAPRFSPSSEAAPLHRSSRAGQLRAGVQCTISATDGSGGKSHFPLHIRQYDSDSAGRSVLSGVCATNLVF